MIQFTFNNALPQYTIEIYIGNAIAEQSTITPIAFEMLVMQFIQMCEQIANENQPMKCVCKGMKEIELPNGDWVTKPSRVEFYNNKWMENINGD